MILEEHLAIVTNNEKDPDLQYAIEVKCDSIGTEGGILPVLAKPIFPPNFLKVPDVGQTVKIFVLANTDDDEGEQSGSIDFPDFVYYDHRILDQSKGKLPADFKKNYPRRAGMWFKDGSILYFDETKGQKEFIIKLTTGNNFFQITESKITIDQNGTKIELENGTMTTTVNTSKIGGSSAAEAMLLGNVIYDAFVALVGTASPPSGWLGAATTLGTAADPTGAAAQAYGNTMVTVLGTFFSTLANWKSSKHFLDS